MDLNNKEDFNFGSEDEMDAWIDNEMNKPTVKPRRRLKKGLPKKQQRKCYGKHQRKCHGKQQKRSPKSSKSTVDPPPKSKMPPSSIVNHYDYPTQLMVQLNHFLSEDRYVEDGEAIRNQVARWLARQKSAVAAYEAAEEIYRQCKGDNKDCQHDYMQGVMAMEAHLWRVWALQTSGTHFMPLDNRKDNHRRLRSIVHDSFLEMPTKVGVRLLALFDEAEKHADSLNKARVESRVKAFPDYHMSIVLCRHEPLRSYGGYFSATLRTSINTTSDGLQKRDSVTLKTGSTDTVLRPMELLGCEPCTIPSHWQKEQWVMHFEGLLGEHTGVREYSRQLLEEFRSRVAMSKEAALERVEEFRCRVALSKVAALERQRQKATGLQHEFELECP